jgi:hypothetical protein
MRMFHLAFFAVAACDTEEPSTLDDTGAPEAEDLAIAGAYLDAFGSDHVITNELWTQTYPGAEPLPFHITSYDNVEQVVIAQNDETSAYSPGLWSRFDWTDGPDGHLYYCQAVFDAPTEAAAEATARPDDADPASTGCGGFAWTDLTP